MRRLQTERRVGFWVSSKLFVNKVPERREEVWEPGTYLRLDFSHGGCSNIWIKISQARVNRCDSSLCCSWWWR